MYDTVIANLDAKNKSGWNGYCLLVILAAVTMYFSTSINMKTMQKKKTEESQKEIEVGYSIRKTRENQPDSAIPSLDPAQMGKIMKYILPAIMLIVTFSSNAAFALYISMGAIIQTSLGLGINALVNLILKKQEAKAKASEPKHPIINPHSRYFKKKHEK
jgi:membrane protein insertase Oxa1/YidC/SpoIIIJ